MYGTDDEIDITKYKVQIARMDLNMTIYILQMNMKTYIICDIFCVFLFFSH